jgi:hypothetical protein
MTIVVYNGLPNVQSRLTHEIFQFLPAAVGGNLPFQLDKSGLEMPCRKCLPPGGTPRIHHPISEILDCVLFLGQEKAWLQVNLQTSRSNDALG